MKKFGVIVGILIPIIIGLGVGIYVRNEEIKKENEQLEQEKQKETVLLLENYYQDEEQKLPKLSITEEELEQLEQMIQSLEDGSEKEKLWKKYKKLKKFYEIQTELDSFFEGDMVKESVTKEEFLSWQEDFDTLTEEEQSLLEEQFQSGMDQITKTEEALSRLSELFLNEEMTEVKEEVDREDYDTISHLFHELKQSFVLESHQEQIDLILKHVEEKEEEERRRIEEERERQRQIALEKKRKEEEERRKIEEAYVEVTGIPFINQRTEQIYNGCEAACLLMSLQYKNLALNYNLHTFAEEVPKHETDPHQGFIHSIYDLEPKNVAHWIAPDALSRFGSQYGTVRDISGSGVSTLKEYLDQGNPVIVYVTSNFNYPTAWDGEVPVNLHVVLLTGYNQITGNYIVLDPWSGRKIIAKQKFEAIYGLMNRAVVVL